jgi:predicted metalloprotease
VRLDDFRESENVEDRRDDSSGGGGFSIGGGHIGIGGIIILLIVSYVTGINPMTLFGAYESATDGGQSQTSSSAPPGRAREGAPADNSGQFVSKVLGSTEDTWTEIFQQQVKGGRYTAPTLVLFSGQTRSACGAAQSAMGPFYCPNDGKVYLDTEFFAEMRARFHACPETEGACAFSQAYVIAHEVGHHVQDLLGILPKVHQAEEQASTDADANHLSVALELQADCFAGVWANHTQQKVHFLDRGDVEAALQTASAIGDDRLQQETRGRVVPDSFTHGTSAQRQHWFSAGLNSGQINACNTFQ